MHSLAGFIFLIGLIGQFCGMIASNNNQDRQKICLLKLNSNRNAQVISDIIKIHGTVDTELPSGERLLHLMVSHNKLNFVGRMIFAGADIASPDKHGMTAFDYVQTPIMRKLLIGGLRLREAVDFCYDPVTGKNDLCMTDED